MIETGVVINTLGEPLYWHEPRHSSGAIPDSRTLWDVIWKAHQDGWLLGVAHSHPGAGVPGPSQEDITTFVAIESALGRALSWWITSADRLIMLRRRDREDPRPLVSGPDRIAYMMREIEKQHEPTWVTELRRRSEICGV